MLKTSDFGEICYKTSTQGHSNQPIFNFIQSIIIIIIIIFMWQIVCKWEHTNATSLMKLYTSVNIWHSNIKFCKKWSINMATYHMSNAVYKQG